MIPLDKPGRKHLPVLNIFFGHHVVEFDVLLELFEKARAYVWFLLFQDEPGHFWLMFDLAKAQLPLVYTIALSMDDPLNSSDVLSLDLFGAGKR